MGYIKVLREGGGSYERGTPVQLVRVLGGTGRACWGSSRSLSPAPSVPYGHKGLSLDAGWVLRRGVAAASLQGRLANNKMPPPRTLQ